tara:strand:+ start:270 stop:455 length:186 start_codon:yes stop_codon:yes gene_type:complete
MILTINDISFNELIIILFITSILVIRFLGAWMLRVNEIIKLQKNQLAVSKEILKELKKEKS